MSGWTGVVGAVVDVEFVVLEDDVVVVVEPELVAPVDLVLDLPLFPCVVGVVLFGPP